MESLSSLKNNLIEKIMVTENAELLVAIQGVLDSTISDKKLSLDSYQIEMLLMSEKDIADGNLISEEDFFKRN